MRDDWLRAELVCQGKRIRPPIDFGQLRDEDLPEICLRMWLILVSIEFTRAEGRLIPLEIFEPLDTLDSVLGTQKKLCIEDYRHVIDRFGEHYHLNGQQTIEISSHSVKSNRPRLEAIRRFN